MEFKIEASHHMAGDTPTLAVGQLLGAARESGRPDFATLRREYRQKAITGTGGIAVAGETGETAVVPLLITGEPRQA